MKIEELLDLEQVGSDDDVAMLCHIGTALKSLYGIVALTTGADETLVKEIGIVVGELERELYRRYGDLIRWDKVTEYVLEKRREEKRCAST